MIKKRISTKFVTGIVTYVNGRIWEPQHFEGYEEPLYTATILIPKDLVKTNEGMNTALESAILNGQSLHRGKFADIVKKNLPIHDGDDENMDEIFRGCWLVNASSVTAPKIFDRAVLPITDCNLLKQGCKVRVSLTFFTHLKNGKHNTGVGCMLGNIQKAFTGNDYEILPDVDYDIFEEEFTRIFLK